MKTENLYKRLLQVAVIILFPVYICPMKTFAQEYSSFTSYEWDNWRSCEWEWRYYYSKNGWVYAYPKYQEPRNFYFRFKYSDLGLKEFSRQEWKTVKQNGGWVQKGCTFEYYITDEFQTMKSCLEKYSYPCAKEHVKEGRPSVLKREWVTTKVHYQAKDEVSTLNFWFADGSAFGLTVWWEYSGNNMKYRY